MKRSILFIALLFPLLALAAQAQKGYPRMLYVTYDGAQVYDSASYLSSVLGELRRGDSVNVMAGEKKFFRITFAGREGFILGSNVAEKKPATGASKKRGASKRSPKVGDDARSTADTMRSEMNGMMPIPDSLGHVAKAPHDNGAPPEEGRSTRSEPDTTQSRRTKSNETQSHSRQCSATTKSGKRCSRTTTDPAGYCWQHRK